MTLLDKLKSLLGMESTDSTPEPRGDVDVTVEREPERADEGADEAGARDAAEGATGEVAADSDAAETGGTDETDGTDAATEVDGAGGTDEEAAPAREGGDEEPAGAEESDAEAPGGDEPTDVIEGIGPAYAERLAEAGVETVAELAAADPGAVADETDIAETRLQRWVERAKNR